MRHNKMRATELLQIVAAVIVAFLFGVLMAIPTILKLELTSSAINYLNRH